MDKKNQERYAANLERIASYIDKMAELGVKQDFGIECGTSADEQFNTVREAVRDMDALCRVHGMSPVFDGDINSPVDVNRYCRMLVKSEFDERRQ